MDWKVGSANTEVGFFINRTCDSTGAITATGSLAYWGIGSITGAGKTQAFRYAATAAAYTAQTVATNQMLGFFPQAPSSTLVGSDIQVAVGWTMTPAVAPLFGVCGVLDAEVTQGTTFSVAMVGSSARTYIAWSTVAGPFGPLSAGTGLPKIAMLWE
jgi:hypothetical protein